ncbi:uncharacterized protein EV154DRAFT_253243 [Mucor mucedo]|uniref:uncharacterized protein n=1 Tax=Mucor mucedo TaxID=29922 RepID=UPI00221F1D2C|nr:uncharacterized protein EV154DRAFT_253243 [Mucor mucedo]KAI7890328.1 hypothetical protein EV154DRAFT_253243 [Mucor mucedo]
MEKNNESLTTKIDASEHPEYIRLMSQLDQSKNERLQKVENWRRYERKSIHDWFAAQKKQAWDDFYFAKRKVRSDLVQEVQHKINRLKGELIALNKQSQAEQQECDYEDWVPPERLYAIGSFVGGASNEEIDRDLVYARQPYNGNNTPNLVYSDYESRSTTDDYPDVVSPSGRTEIASTSTTTMNDHFSYQQTGFEQEEQTNYPPFEFEEMPQDGRCDWWPYRSTTTA